MVDFDHLPWGLVLRIAAIGTIFLLGLWTEYRVSRKAQRAWAEVNRREALVKVSAESDRT